MKQYGNFKKINEEVGRHLLHEIGIEKVFALKFGNDFPKRLNIEKQHLIFLLEELASKDLIKIRAAWNGWVIKLSDQGKNWFEGQRNE